jgi:ATP-dependent RNA helicase DDX24/MAK5
MGEAAVGLSLSLIAPGEDKAHDKVCEALKSKHLFETVHMDGRLLAAAQERTNLAAKIVACDEVETKAHRSNKWFQEAAEQAGLDLDDDMLDEGLAGGDPRDQLKLREAKAARGRLRQLLAQPMQTQRVGKFLSSNGAAVDPEVAAYVVPLTTTGRKKKKRKG